MHPPPKEKKNCTPEEVRHASQNADSFCINSNTKKGMLSQQFVTHVAPPLPAPYQN